MEEMDSPGEGGFVLSPSGLGDALFHVEPARIVGYITGRGEVGDEISCTCVRSYTTVRCMVRTLSKCTYHKPRRLSSASQWLSHG
jgi:hypothetical protein